jgi:hypothetical protein
MGSGTERWAAFLLLAALIALSAIVVWVNDAAVRLVLSLITASVALWAAVTPLTPRRGPPSGKDRRRHLRLRARTDELLTHIRQMNLIAAQARIGRRPPGQAEEDLNEIEQQVYLLVPEIRRAVGR